MKSKEELKKRIVESSIAKEHDLLGCTPEEIEKLEQQYGKLNSDYKDILSVIGHRAGRLVDAGEFHIYYDQILAANQYVRSMMEEITQDCIAENCLDEIPPMPEHYFVISAAYGGDYPHFILTDSDDPAVYLLNDDAEVIKAENNVWDWIMGFVVYSEQRIAEGLPARPGRYVDGNR